METLVTGSLILILTLIIFALVTSYPSHWKDSIQRPKPKTKPPTRRPTSDD